MPHKPYVQYTKPEILDLVHHIDHTNQQPRQARLLALQEAQLAAAGVPTDKLLSQRFEVAKKRAAASLAGNKALAGRDIEITGYVIPVQEPGSDEVIAGYLVPEQGMCSHMPAPDPNQMIRYRLSTGWRAEYVYEPVRLIGRLSLKTSRKPFRWRWYYFIF